MMWRSVLTLLAGSAAAAAADSTAVFSYDTATARLVPPPERSLGDLLAEWAESCQIVSEPGRWRLDCDAAPANAAPGDPAPVALALFRDLDETIYLAGCPAEASSERESEEAPPAELPAPPCEELAAGQTYSAELDGDRLTIVFRGTALPLQVFRTQPKPRRISTAEPLEPSRASLGPSGPATVRAPEAPEQPEARFDPPPPPDTATAPRNPEPSARGPRPAQTSLQTGEVRLSCSAGAAQLWLDGAVLGPAPATAPLSAGRHQARAVRSGVAPLEREFRIAAGQRLDLDVCGSNP